MMPSVVILAGGLATRMRPLTTTLPKSLIEVAGRPFIDHQLYQLKQQGIEAVTLCVGFLGEQVQAHVQNGAAFGLNVTYAFDGDTLLGTGGAIQQALPLLSDPFFVLYGDSLLQCDFHAIHQAFCQSNALALMTVLRNQNQWDKSNVHFEQNRLVLYDKAAPTPAMMHIDYGLGLVSKAAFDSAPAVPFDLATLYHALSQQQQLAGFEVFERFYEIGSPTGLQETDTYLQERETT